MHAVHDIFTLAISEAKKTVTGNPPHLPHHYNTVLHVWTILAHVYFCILFCKEP